MSQKKNPAELFARWYTEAIEREVKPEAASLNTYGLNGYPNSRIVLIKHMHNNQYMFFSRALSQKGKEMKNNPKVLLLFYWKSLGRQVKITGTVTTVDTKEAEQYFHSRPIESQIASSITLQSKRMDSYEALYKTFIKQKKAYEKKPDPIKMPDDWTEYQLHANYYEFFQDNTHRLHQRLIFVKDENDLWDIQWLNP